MRDTGVSINRNSKQVAKLSATVQDMMNQWADDQFTYFKQTMELIREGAPVQWVKLYMEAVKMGIIKETNVNININREADRANLQALVRSRVTSVVPEQERTPLPDRVYTPYEEVEKVQEQNDTKI
ncbi:MAG: hypothetical protein K6D91_06055 [Prevotella sp.]|nr:hypothetical protein [Prevotella sp.]